MKNVYRGVKVRMILFDLKYKLFCIILLLTRNQGFYFYFSHLSPTIIKE